MRIAALLLAIAVVPLRADDAAKAIVAKALKATGWENRKSGHATWKDKGKFSSPGGPDLAYEGEFHVTYPDKYRNTFKVSQMGQEIECTITLDGEKGWEKALGKVRELKDEELAYMKAEVYSMYVMSLKPLVDDKEGFETKVIDELQVNERKCAGISAAKKDKPAIKLYFDAETGLPAKLEYTVKNEFDAWKPATDEFYFLDWADDGDQKAFKKMKVTRNGKTMIESELSDFKMPERVDPKLYDKP